MNMHSCTACSLSIDPERFELLYEGKGMKYCVCQVCASKGIAQPEKLHGIVSCNENGEHEGMSVLTSYQWSMHLSAFGKTPAELEESTKEDAVLDDLNISV
jgi:hypothetical protein